MAAPTYKDLKGEVVGVCVSGARAAATAALADAPVYASRPRRRARHPGRAHARAHAHAGGLDSKTVSKRLVEAGVKVLAFSADLGQPDESDIQNVKKRMATCGVDTVIIDLKDDMAEGCFDVIQAQATYDGGYWNTTGIGRFVTCRGLVNAMKEKGVTVLSHGATGRGNDQMRFERYTNVLAPTMRVYAPWRDPLLLKEFPGRTEMAAYLNKFNIEAFVGPKKKYSTDANLAGLSHEAEDLESITTPMTIVEPEMGVWPQAAPDKPEMVELKFVEVRARARAGPRLRPWPPPSVHRSGARARAPEPVNSLPLTACCLDRTAARAPQGRCVAVNGKAMRPVEVIKEANTIGGRNGLGLKHALENRIIGTKSRGVYEAPGMELLGVGLRYLYQAVLDRRSAEFFEHCSSIVSNQIYDGRYFDPSTRAALSAIKQLTAPASGTVTVQAYKGNITFVSLKDVAASIYNEADSSMEKSDGLNPVSSQGASARARAARLRTGAELTSRPGRPPARRTLRARRAHARLRGGAVGRGQVARARRAHLGRARRGAGGEQEAPHEVMSFASFASQAEAPLGSTHSSRH